MAAELRRYNNEYHFALGLRKFAALAIVFLVCMVLPSAEVKGDAGPADPFMGDWQGSWTLKDESGSGQSIAQVIALGGGQYRANLLEEFDMRIDPVVVMQGRREGSTVKFAGESEYEGYNIRVEAVIEGGKFSGSFGGENPQGETVSGTFSMQKVVRLSPTLGAKPPKNAIVLFDGKNFDEWEPISQAPGGVVGLLDILGPSENSVAYLRSALWSAERQKARLEIGSDDGVKVWLNGGVVHSNNVMRGLRAGEDKVDIVLKKGWNELLVKVTQAGGGWEVCVRLVGPDGKMLSNVNEMVSAESSDTGTNKYLQNSGGFLSLWEVAGPYREEAKGAEALFDVVFAPEKDGAEVRGKSVNVSESGTSGVRWRLVDGAMEIRAGTGSIITKKKFRDFRLHLEFRTPFMPDSRGQGRGNSGVYLQGRYEVQVLDSYALEGADNECGGIYRVGRPRVNMCAAPMQWQTYDIEFHSPQFDDSGVKKDDAWVTVVHNGVEIHAGQKLKEPTYGAAEGNVAEPGGIYLQDHGNAVQFRNIWLVELPEEQASR